MAMTWQQVVEDLGFFINQCEQRNHGQLVCDWCPAHEVCVSEPDTINCGTIIEQWAKEETGSL